MTAIVMDMRELSGDEIDLIAGAYSYKEVAEAFLVGAGAGSIIGSFSGPAGTAIGAAVGGAVGIAALYL